MEVAAMVLPGAVMALLQTWGEDDGATVGVMVLLRRWWRRGDGAAAVVGGRGIVLLLPR